MSRSLVTSSLSEKHCLQYIHKYISTNREWERSTSELLSCETIWGSLVRTINLVFGQKRKKTNVPFLKQMKKTIFFNLFTKTRMRAAWMCCVTRKELCCSLLLYLSFIQQRVSLQLERLNNPVITVACFYRLPIVRLLSNNDKLPTLDS